MQWKGSFLPGKRYYVTVECCNRAQLCSVSSSNGVIIDNSIPISGIVTVGMSDRHSTYIGHSASVHTRWIGFQDPDSDIHHFEVCISKNQSVCTITGFRNVLLTTSITITDLKLPVGEKLYVIVKAFNQAGLFITKSSDYFIVDVTPPVLLQTPEFLSNNINSLNKSTQWDVSFVKMAWNFSDNDSSIVSQRISLKTHSRGHAAIEIIELTNEKEITVLLEPKKWLRSGDLYYAIITACNAAHLCTSSKSKTILFDSTPPHLGGFKKPLMWKKRNDSFAVLYLTWYGFSDIESNVEEYFITAGETYSGDKTLGGVESFSHRGYSGSEQNGTLDLKKTVVNGQKIFLSIWARNYVGLYSSVRKISVYVDALDSNSNEGELLIEKHSCSAEYCNKDCTCAVIGGKCTHLTVNDTCKEITHKNQLFDMNVILNSGNPFSLSSSCLKAEWSTKNSSIILRYEWSMGLENMPIGDGIFDILHESVWHDIRKRSNIIHCLPVGKQLHHDESYIVYVRTWLSKTEYRILLLRRPPAIRKGSFIKDSDHSCLTDFIYTNITDTVTTCWKKVFSDSQSKITNYEAFIGTDKEVNQKIESQSDLYTFILTRLYFVLNSFILYALIFLNYTECILVYYNLYWLFCFCVLADDVVQIQDMGLRTSFTWTNLTLHAGTKYFITVRATNGVGLKSSLSSDGFVIDYEKPYAGVVFNTLKFTNRQFQSSSDTLNISWQGFEDHHSFIRQYMVAIVSINATDLAFIMPFTKFGIKNSVKLHDLNLRHNHRYKALVKAVDAAGYESEISKSETLLIDKTPPSGFTCTKYTVRKNFVAYYTDFSIMVNDTYGFHRDISYLIKIQVHNTSDNTVCKLIVGSFSVILPTYFDFDGMLKSEYYFLSPFAGSMPISIEVKGVFNHSAMYANLCECKSMLINENNDSALTVRQMSPSMISICINVIDPESGIQGVFLGAGTTPNGFQIRSLSPLSLINHVTINVNLPHGTPVYITAIIKNHAGLEKSFKSSKIILDHTPPFVTNTKASIMYNTIHNDKSATVNMQWKVVDEESNLKICLYSLGNSPQSADIQEWTASESYNSCHIYNISAKHGTVLYGTVRCVNEIGLYMDVGFNPVEVSFRPPTVPISTDITFIEHADCNLNETVISNKSVVLLGWSEFIDTVKVINYQCQIKEEKVVVADWLDTGNRTNLNLSAITLNSHAKYTAYIRAMSNNNNPSMALNASFLIERNGPYLSGSSAVVSKANSYPNKVRLNWDQVFILDRSLFKYYILTVGTEKGMCDVIRYKETKAESLDLDLENGTKELYVVISAVYCTDMTTVYRQLLSLE
ncbi:hypothetical protein KUTeg_010171 [Tegillarca granosa]|uniref:Uncharacterized protein n=1 Tax=Tegillarca granosa TaxID=220873 RepID=A0ABQ9F604_TEGGR|nr:hypothetical protein KUTeg_010171 [Tegillarca granosa]